MIKETIRTSRKVNEMTDFQFRLWVYLITYVDDYGRGSADAEVLKGVVFTRRKRVTELDIEKALAELAGIGCIRLYNVDGESYFYFPNWGDHQRIQSKYPKFPEPTDKNTIPYDSTVSHGGFPQPTEINRYKSNTNTSTSTNTKKLLSKLHLDARALDALFEKFWEAYPRHEAKQAALKKFKQLNPDEELVREMIRWIGLARQSQQWQDKQYIPKPDTWINQKRWEDDPPPIAPTVGVIRAPANRPDQHARLKAEIAADEPEYQVQEKQPEIWEYALKALQKSFGNHCVDTWFKPVNCRGMNSGVLELEVPTKSFQTAITDFIPTLRELTSASEVRIQVFGTCTAHQSG